MTLKEITILSVEEYQKYKPVIPLIEDWWWLRAPRYDQVHDAVVFCDGFVVRHVLSKDSLLLTINNIGVRPALKLNLEISDSLFWYKPEKLIGTKIKYSKYQWTVLNANFGELYVLCDDIIARRRFDSNDWDKSELKQWLETEGIKFITPQGDDINDVTNNNSSDG